MTSVCEAKAVRRSATWLGLRSLSTESSREGSFSVPGLPGASIDRRIEKGALLVEYPGVYRVGHRAPSVEARYMAAVLACGEGALLSGLAAAHLLGLLKEKPPEPEVTAPTQRRVKGIRTRCVRAMHRRDATSCRGIPVTTVPATLVDLAAGLDVDDLARVCHEAGVRYRTTPARVEAVLSRRSRVKGAPKLRAILHGEVKVTLSQLEKQGLHVIEQAGAAPTAEVNRRAGSKRVDFRWPEYGLTVELDSFRYHNSLYSWKQDRRREREAHARGDEFRRYTIEDVFEDTGPMLRELLVLLAPDRRSAHL